MMYKRFLLLFIFHITLINSVLSQNYEELFKGTRVINGHSVNAQNEGELEFLIEHRFGRINGGAYNLYGLDQSTIRFGLEYGIKNWVSIGFGRSSFKKTFDGFAKVRLYRQQSGDKNIPFSLTLLSAVSLNSLKFQDTTRENYFSSRLSFTHQILIAKKFSERLSLQLMPTIVHRNLVPTTQENNLVVSIGIAGRYKLTKTIATSIEYYYVLPGQISETYHNSLAIGFEIDTGGHAFQFHFTNSTGMLERDFIAENTGDFQDGDIHLGFNITRIFKIKGRRY